MYQPYEFPKTVYYVRVRYASSPANGIEERTDSVPNQDASRTLELYVVLYCDTNVMQNPDRVPGDRYACDPTVTLVT